MAIRYVWNDGGIKYSNTGFGVSPVSVSYIKSVIDASATGDTIILSGGANGVTYPGTLMNDNFRIPITKNLYFRGCGADDLGVGDHYGPVTLDFEGRDVVGINSWGGWAKLANLILKNSGPANNYAISMDLPGNELYNIVIENYTQGIKAVGETTANRIAVKKFAHLAVTANGCTFNISNLKLIEGFGNSFEAIRSEGISPILNINNCTISLVDFYVAAARAGAININNGIVVACGKQCTDIQFLEIGGTIAFNGLVLPSVTAPKSHQDYSAIAGTRIHQSPGFVSSRSAVPKNGSYVFDDYASVDDWYNAIGVSLPGQVLTVAVSNQDDLTNTQLDMLVDGINKGHEIACHTNTHSSINNSNCFSIVYTGSATTATLAITEVDGFAKALTITTTGAVDNITIADLSIHTMTSLVAAMVSQSSNYTITNLSTGRKARVLATVAAQDVKTAVYTALCNDTRLYDDEITYAKNQLEARIRERAASLGLSASIAGTYVVDTFVYPNNARSADTDAALKSRGFLCARANVQYISGFTSLNMYSLPEAYLTNLAATDASAQSVFDVSALAYAEHSAEDGRSLCFWTHGIEVDPLATLAYHTKSLKAISDAGINLIGLKACGADYQARWIDSGDGITWTRIISDHSDYHLQATSPCIGIGTDAGVLTDVEGNTIPGTFGFDLGVYSYIKPTSDNFGPWVIFDPTSFTPPVGLSTSAVGEVLRVAIFTGTPSISQINDVVELGER